MSQVREPDGSDARMQAMLRVEGGMPTAVWDRLQAALDAEALNRAEHGATRADVVDIRSRRRAPVLFAGAAAAAVVLVAAGLLVNATQGTRAENPAVVADGGFAPAGATENLVLGADAPVGAAAPLKSESAVQSTGDGSLPVRRVVQTGLDYGSSSMKDNVQEVIDTIGASNAQLMSDVQPDPDPPGGVAGFTTTLVGLRSCINWLMGHDRGQALVVDRALYKGRPVGVVIVPTTDGASGGSMLEALEVWVVTLDCTHEHESILEHTMIGLGAP